MMEAEKQTLPDVKILMNSPHGEAGHMLTKVKKLLNMTLKPNDTERHS